MQKKTIFNFMPLVLFLLFFLGMAAIQFATPDLPDNDGFYHIKLAWLMRTEGLKPEFHWMPLSILNQREFYDHHFLFHVALIPFTFGDLRLGAKWACRATAFAPAPIEEVVRGAKLAGVQIVMFNEHPAKTYDYFRDERFDERTAEEWDAGIAREVHFE